MKTLKYRIKGMSHVADPVTGEVKMQELLATVEGEEATEENIRRAARRAVDGAYEVTEDENRALTLHRRLAQIEAAWDRVRKLLNLN